MVTDALIHKQHFNVLAGWNRADFNFFFYKPCGIVCSGGFQPGEF